MQSSPRGTALAYGPDRQQSGVLYLPSTPGPHPVVVLLHGGFWHAPFDLSLMIGLAEDLVQHGVVVWNVEYRRIEDPGGGWPGTFLDVAQAINFLKTLALTSALDLERITLVGHSAGGHLALWLAGQNQIPQSSPLFPQDAPPRFAAAVSLAGVLDLEQGWRLRLGNGSVAALLGGSPDEVPERYAAASPAALLPLKIPQFLLHGTRDSRVPLEMSQTYAQKATEAGDPVTLIELPGVDHFALIDETSDAWVRARAIILKG